MVPADARSPVAASSGLALLAPSADAADPAFIVPAPLRPPRIEDARRGWPRAPACAGLRRALNGAPLRACLRSPIRARSRRSQHGPVARNACACARGWPLRRARSVSAAGEPLPAALWAERLTCCTGGKYTRSGSRRWGAITQPRIGSRTSVRIRSPRGGYAAVLYCCTQLSSRSNYASELWSYGDSNPRPLACHQHAGHPPKSIAAGHRPRTCEPVLCDPARLRYFPAVLSDRSTPEIIRWRSLSSLLASLGVGMLPCSRYESIPGITSRLPSAAEHGQPAANRTVLVCRVPAIARVTEVSELRL
jgi:hypothetical protein